MLSVGTEIGSYRILAPLGVGGMGEVYRARDLNLGRDVALKVIRGEHARDPGRIGRFEQEARAAGALCHPGVCTVFSIGTHEGSPFVVMELLEGESLRARLNRGPIPLRKAVDWIVQAARGVAAAHARGIVHRDLKPENLFLTAEGRVKVLDFGLAKLTRPDSLAETDTDTATIVTTAAGEVLGTTAYMSPEQVRGEPVDHRADLFALGGIFYELLTGRQAFAASAPYETTYRIVNDDPPSLVESGREVPPAIEGIVRRCLEKRPSERFQSAQDLAIALECVSLTSPAAVTTPVPRGRESRPWRRLPPWAAVVLGVVVLGIGLLAGRFGGGRREAAPPVASYQRLTVDRGRIFSARFVVESQSVVYAAAWAGRPVELFEVRPGDSSSRGIGLARANLLAVTRTGSLAVALGQDNFTGWARPGTLAELPVAGGQPRRVLDDVMSADWSSDAQTLAVAHEVAGKSRLEMPPGKVLFESSGRLNWVRVSPSGEWVAFVENPVPPDTRGSVVIVDREGRVKARSEEWNSLLGVAWSRDGREAWFTATQEGAASDLRALTPGGAQRIVHRFPGYMVLHDIGPDGQMLLAREHITVGIRGRRSSAEEERELGWLDWSTAYDISQDGRTLLFDEQGLGGGSYYAVCLRGMDGSPPVRLGEGHGCSLSPDGRTVLGTHFGTPNRLFLMPTGAGSTVTLPRGTIERYRGAQWLPDGRGFVFTAAEAGRIWRTWRQAAGGGDPRPITPEGIVGVNVSPDGRFVAATDPAGRLYIYPLAGGEPLTVAQLGPDELVVDWTPDGRALIVGEKGTSMRLSRIDLDDGRREPFGTLDLPDAAGACVWSAYLTSDGAGYAYSYFRWVDDLYLVKSLS